jgi:hypothetical protein
MRIKDHLLRLVPEGEENAVSSRLLWQQLGMWSFATIKQRLSEMAAEGLIERKQVWREARSTNLYFRRPNSADSLQSWS